MAKIPISKTWLNAKSVETTNSKKSFIRWPIVSKNLQLTLIKKSPSLITVKPCKILLWCWKVLIFHSIKLRNLNSHWWTKLKKTKRLIGYSTNWKSPCAKSCFDTAKHPKTTSKCSWLSNINCKTQNIARNCWKKRRRHATCFKSCYKRTRQRKINWPTRLTCA